MSIISSINHFQPAEFTNSIRSIFTQLLNRSSAIELEEMEEQLSHRLSPHQLPADWKQQLHQWYSQVHSLNYLTKYITLPQLREVMVQGHSIIQTDQGQGVIDHLLSSLTRDDLILSLEYLTQKNGINWSFKKPFASFQVELNRRLFRATALHHSISADNSPRLYLRHQEQKLFAPADFLIPKELHPLLSEWVKQRKNILISGASGSGKSAFVRMLLKLIPRNEHVIVLEDTVELEDSPQTRTNLIANERESGKSLNDLCTYALRMRPDRIIVGELRGGEVTSMLLALNSGHRGLISTLHANSAVDSIQRVVLLYALHTDRQGVDSSLLTKLICQNIDLVIHLDKCQLQQVIEVIGCEGVTPYFQEIYPKSAPD
jgi:type IV secretion system protein VirB11